MGIGNKLVRNRVVLKSMARPCKGIYRHQTVRGIRIIGHAMLFDIRVG